MRHLFTIPRTAATLELYLPGHAELLTALLTSIARTLDRVLPEEVSRRIDREGSTAAPGPGGRLVVHRHPDLERARQELAALDLFRIFLPEDVGGLGLPVGVYYLAVQLIAAYDASLALVFLVQGNAMYALDRFGTATQRRRYLPALASGERLATVAFTEAQAGSDAGNIRTSAARQGTDYRVTGHKLWITHGGDADLMLVTARTGPLEAGLRGVSAFIVEREADGVELVGLEDKTGLQGSPTAELDLPELVLPADRRLGAEGQGGQVMQAGVGMTRVNIGAQALGIGKRAFDAAVDHACQRVQGGKIILEHDAVQTRLGDMALALAAMEGLICQVARLEEEGAWHVREMSEAKYFCSEALQEVTLRAINVFGGYGVSRALPVERCRREAVALPLFGGTSEIQWFIIARELLTSARGEARADYQARDRAAQEALARRCTGELAALADRVADSQHILWRLAQRLAPLPEEAVAPYYRHLTELDVSLAVARTLLVQAAGPSAGPLERELAREAADRLAARAASADAAIGHGRADTALKAALLASIGR